MNWTKLRGQGLKCWIRTGKFGMNRNQTIIVSIMNELVNKLELIVKGTEILVCNQKGTGK